MTNQTYTIEYVVHQSNGGTVKGKMKVKNCMSEIHAKVRLEEHLRKKYANFNSVVMPKCESDYGLDDLFTRLGDIFKPR